jgi:hypothetical protein
MTTVSKQVRAAYNFDVEKRALMTIGGHETPHFGLFRTDTNECVGKACGATYTPHTVDDVVAVVEAAAAAFEGDAKVSANWKDGHFVTVIPSKEYRRAVYGTDTLNPRLIIRAGYDGRAWRSSFGYFRDACLNLSMLRVEGVPTTVAIRHTRGLQNRRDELIEQFRTLTCRWDGVVEVAERLDAAQVELAAFIREVYPLTEDAAGKTVTTHEQRLGKIVMRIMRERAQLGRPTDDFHRVTAWEAFNGVQGYVQHDMPRRKAGSDRFLRMATALEDPSVQRAMDLALSLTA